MYLTSGILRGESVYRVDLSDFKGNTVAANERDLYPLYLMIMQIPFGKTNRGCGTVGPLGIVMFGFVVLEVYHSL